MSKGSILVVDDESEVREGLEMLLAGEGYGVSSAETGESGLGKLDERPFDLLLLDVSLPDRNGIELLREIRSRDPHLPIVLITAYGSIEMARAAFKSGRWTTSRSRGRTTNCWRKWRRRWSRGVCGKKTFN
jgi:two-component system response regulator HydG